MIQIITGKLGAGKTFFTVVHLLFPALLKGRTVVTNIEVDWDQLVIYARRKHRIELDPRQLVKIDPNEDKNWQRSIPFGSLSGFVEVFLDEIHLFFNARDWAKTSAESNGLVSFLTQSRKARVNITFIVQDESTMDKQFRIQAEWLLYVVPSTHMPLGMLGTLPFKFFVVCFKDAKNGNLLKREYKSYDKRCFRLYQSYSFLDSEGKALSENAVHVEPLKLRRISIFRWAWEPVQQAGVAFFRGIHLYFKPAPKSQL